MEVVSMHSFTEDASSPPEQELIHMLMELVVQGSVGKSTRPFSPFVQDTIDPRPVVRSFILQLLLKYRLQVTQQYVDMAFADAQKLIQIDAADDLEDLSVLFVDCFEDSLYQRSLRLPVEERLSAAVEELKQCKERLCREQFTVEHMQGIAGAKFGISICAEALGDMIIDENQLMSMRRVESSPPNIPTSVVKLIDATRGVVETVEEPQLLLFLLKQLVRHRGFDIVNRLEEKYGIEMQWLLEMFHEDMVQIGVLVCETNFYIYIIE
jgi:hypothetical protein